MSDLAKIYSARFSKTGFEKRDRVWKVLCQHYFDDLVGPDKSVLDLACGYGEFINNVRAARKFAVDLNPDSPSYLNPDVSFTHTGATELGHLADGTIDVVFTSNFLEHLPSKKVCDDVFKEIFRVLKPGGRFVVMGPNIRFAYREYWDYYDHYLPLSYLSLVEGLMLAGFVPQRVVDRFLPYTMNNATPTNDFMIKAYLKLPVAWKFLGKQFLVVAGKP